MSQYQIMAFDFTDLKELRARYLTEPVTLAYCDNPNHPFRFEGDAGNDPNAFNPNGPDGMADALIECLRQPGQSTMDAFYAVDKAMRFYKDGLVPLIMVYPVQEIVTDPYDADEMKALIAIAKVWAEDTGAKIVLILDTSNKWPYYIKKFY